MNWIEIVVNAVVTIIGLVGGSFGIIYWRENKRLKQEEVDSAKIDNELKQAEAWQKLFEEEHKNAQIKLAEKSERLKALYAERDELKKELNDAIFNVQRLQWYHCTVDGCHRRRPPHHFDDDGSETIAHELQACSDCRVCDDCTNESEHTEKTKKEDKQ